MKQECVCFELEPIFETQENKEYITGLKCCDCGEEYVTTKRTKEVYMKEIFLSE